MGFLFELSSVEVRELMMQAMIKRMTSRNLHWERRLDGFLFSIDDESCMPTLSMHAERTISIRSPMDCVVFHAENGINVSEALKSLLGMSTPSEIFLLPGGNLEARVGLQCQCTVGEHDIQLFAGVPCALNVALNSFALVENKSPSIVVLTKDGPYVLRRDHGMTVADVVTIIDHNCGIRCSHLVGSLGERHPMQTICPDAVFAMDVEGAANDLQIWDFVRVLVDERGIRFQACLPVLRDLFEFFSCHCSGLHHSGFGMVPRCRCSGSCR